MSEQSEKTKTPLEILEDATQTVGARKRTVETYARYLGMAADEPPPARFSFFTSIFGDLGYERSRSDKITLYYGDAVVSLSEGDEKTVREIARQALLQKYNEALVNLEIAKQDLADAALAFAAGEGVPLPYSDVQLGTAYDRRVA